ncbi:MAG: DUF3052 domain-containing protein [Candidatus Eisenbacteria bacterium]|nr:DUF3052 domain-containing protein [Candidatus Eisenbacteria bacterium]MCC7141084.1 DUF3052 domain-containing protein [Candidatus Eisenbacteria bacterium]
MPGYSGTPLIQKLGWRAGGRVYLLTPPAEYREWLGPSAQGIEFTSRVPAAPEAAHLFVTERRVLAASLERLRGRLVPTGVIWVSWPKKTAKVPTDITEDTIRDVALPLGYVDVKVCAVSDVWSGLKLMIRKGER